MENLSQSYWIVSCREFAEKIIPIRRAYMGTSGEALDNGLPEEFSVPCQHCKMSHDYCKAEVKLARLPRARRDFLPTVTAKPST